MNLGLMGWEGNPERFLLPFLVNGSILLIGPNGGGKTYFGQSVASSYSRGAVALGQKPLRSRKFLMPNEGDAQLAGFVVPPLPDDDKKQSRFLQVADSVFDNEILLLDEVSNAIAPYILHHLLQPIDSHGNRTLMGQIFKPEAIIMTMNIPGYGGVRPLTHPIADRVSAIINVGSFPVELNSEENINKLNEEFYKGLMSLSEGVSEEECVFFYEKVNEARNIKSIVRSDEKTNLFLSKYLIRLLDSLNTSCGNEYSFKWSMRSAYRMADLFHSIVSAREALYGNRLDLDMQAWEVLQYSIPNVAIGEPVDFNSVYATSHQSALSSSIVVSHYDLLMKLDPVEKLINVFYNKLSADLSDGEVETIVKSALNNIDMSDEVSILCVLSVVINSPTSSHYNLTRFGLTNILKMYNDKFVRHLYTNNLSSLIVRLYKEELNVRPESASIFKRVIETIINKNT